MRAQTTVSQLKTYARDRAPRDIGTLLIEAGKLRAEDADQVLRLQEQAGLRFGEAAIQLGLVTQIHVNEALAQQFEYRYLAVGQSSISREVIAAYDPFSPAVDELRALRAQLMFRYFGRADARRGLAVVGCDVRGGRSYIAANLAVVFSQLGQRTLLIDADMRNPRQHELFGIGNSTGFSAVLAGRADLSAVQRITDLVDLSVLTAGPVPPNPSELLERETFAEVMAQFTADYDVVLFDTPSTKKGMDACSVATRAGAAMVVVRRYRARVRSLQALVEMLPGVEILGTVLNDR